MAALKMALLLVGGASAAYDFANPKVSACVASRTSWGTDDNSWLNTKNPSKYMCTSAQIDAHYDPANLACWQSDPQGPSGDIASGTCPAGKTVACLMQAGWGQVAGNCDACANDDCSRTGATGSKSCAAEACTKDGTAAVAGAKCAGNKWVDGASPVDKAHVDGYCDCSPDCGVCDDGPPGFLEVGVDSSACDVRNGTLPAADGAGCWDSCVDCMGDDDSHGGPGAVHVAFMPEAMGAKIVGAANWTTYNVGHANSTGTWWLCKTDSPTHKGDCAWQGMAPTLPYSPKFKGLALCA